MYRPVIVFDLFELQIPIIKSKFRSFFLNLLHMEDGERNRGPTTPIFIFQFYAHLTLLFIAYSALVAVKKYKALGKQFHMALYFLQYM